MPSHLDVNDDASRTPSFTPTKGLSSDSESESDSNKEIYFHSKHFNGSSSSEDDLYKQKGKTNAYAVIAMRLSSSRLGCCVGLSSCPASSSSNVVFRWHLQHYPRSRRMHRTIALLVWGDVWNFEQGTRRNSADESRKAGAGTQDWWLRNSRQARCVPTDCSPHVLRSVICICDIRVDLGSKDIKDFIIISYIVL